MRAPELPGVTADMGEIRVYPYSGAFAHVIGYVAKVSKDDVTKTGPNSDPILLNPGFRIGKAGLEQTYDLPMRGKPGAKKVDTSKTKYSCPSFGLNAWAKQGADLVHCGAVMQVA